MGDRAGRTLIVGPAWVGDMVMAQSLFQLLRKHRPQTPIDVLAPAWSRPLLERMPQVSRTLDMPFGHGDLCLSERYRFGRSLRGHGYTRAMVLPNSFKSALVPVFAGIAERVGWRGEMRYGLLTDIRKLDKHRYPMMVQRFLALAYPPGAALPEPLPYPALQVDPRRRAERLAAFGLSLNRPVLALCPGAEFGPAKRWPPEYFAQVAAEKIAQGWQVWLMGSGRDNEACERLMQALPDDLLGQCHSLAGATTLDQAIDLLAAADAVVSNDSGLMHIAAALDRPLVVVYGSTSAEFTPPLASRVRTVNLPVDCGPCFERECPLGHTRCLRDLPPARVLEALAAVEPKMPVEVAQ